MTSRTKPWLLVLLVMPLALAAISDSAEERRPAEPDLAERVRLVLLRLPDYGVFDLLSFQVSGDTVTLGGTVHRAIVKTEAAEALARTPGVARVVDRVQVLPASIEDERLRREVFWKIYTDEFLAKYDAPVAPLRNYAVHIIVENAKVSLFGAVRSSVDRAQAAVDTNLVAGVRSVVNDIQVVAD